MTRYRTIVADPPWVHERTGFSFGDSHFEGNRYGPTHSTRPTYPMLSVAEISALPVGQLAETDAHLYLWTTNHYLHDAYHIADAWGFRPIKPLIWCKEPKGFMGKPFVSSAEFVLYCRRGSLPVKATAGRQWWTWARTAHSQKPEAFLDVVERVSPGPYLELFARRNRLGWDTWGNEAIEHVDLAI